VRKGNVMAGADKSVYTLVIASLLTIGFSTDCVRGQSRPDLLATEQFNGALSTCAAGLDVSVSSDIVGSITSIYAGERTNGVASFKTATRFLELFPQADRATIYKIYVECITKILKINSTQSAPAIENNTMNATEGGINVLSGRDTSIAK
jgi:hypothetical protein